MSEANIKSRPVKRYSQKKWEKRILTSALKNKMPTEISGHVSVCYQGIKSANAEGVIQESFKTHPSPSKTPSPHSFEARNPSIDSTCSATSGMALAGAIIHWARSG